MTELHTPQDEDLSALMDGELHGPARESAITCVLSEPNVRNTWHSYCVVGDVLRSGELSGAAQDLQFLAKLETRLAQEPPPTATAVLQPDKPMLSLRYRQSANGPIFWRLLTGVACSALVAVIGISVWSPGGVSSSGSMAGITPPAVTVNAAQPAPLEVALGPDGMIRDPRLDQFLSAHQQLGGHSALQMPSGFLRNATYGGASQ